MCYEDLPTALDLVKQLACIAGAEQDAYLTSLLQASGGIGGKNQAFNYRPHYVVAKFLESSVGSARITAADGVQLADLSDTVDGLLSLQKGFDKSCCITVPEGFEAISSDCLDCGESENLELNLIPMQIPRRSEC